MTTAVNDAKTHSVIATLPVGLNSNATFTPDGKVAFVTNSDSDTVTIIKIKTHSVTATIQLLFPPSNVIFTPEGKFAYVFEVPS
ncbi:hypothetical protein [Bacillus sp. SM2101]|uniref:YncE family protein n=1 Tax=Bacillus sp. SM2101 TaxID=2805366 RepID=UPI001BDE0BD3|nr:hypothetical protein [Bacillus sp. SM2101]